MAKLLTLNSLAFLRSKGRGLLRLVIWSVRFAFVLLLMMLAVDWFVGVKVQHKIYEEVEQVPFRENLVVLGTAKYYATGSPNLYYKYRLEAAKSLFNAQKARQIWVSGDNKTPYYNEPKMMTNDLRRMGITHDRISQDYAGYNTLDSVIRASHVYQLAPFTLVTQAFHCERALFIAEFYGIDAICFAATYPEGHYKVRLREIFARSAMLFSLLTGYQPETLEKVGARIPAVNNPSK